SSLLSAIRRRASRFPKGTCHSRRQPSDLVETSRGSILTGRISIRERRYRRHLVALGLHLFLHFVNGAIQLLVNAFKLLCRVVINHDIGINTVTFNNPALSVLRVRRKLRFEKLATIDEGQGISNSDHTA